MRKGIQFKVWDRRGHRSEAGVLVTINDPNRFWMNIVGANGKVMMTGEGYPTAAHAHRAVDRMWSGFYKAAYLEGIGATRCVPYHKDSLLPKARRPK